MSEKEIRRTRPTPSWWMGSNLRTSSEPQHQGRIYILHQAPSQILVRASYEQVWHPQCQHLQLCFLTGKTKTYCAICVRRAALAPGGNEPGGELIFRILEWSGSPQNSICRLAFLIRYGEEPVRTVRAMAASLGTSRPSICPWLPCIWIALSKFASVPSFDRPSPLERVFFFDKSSRISGWEQWHIGLKKDVHQIGEEFVKDNPLLTGAAFLKFFWLAWRRALKTMMLLADNVDAHIVSQIAPHTLSD